MRFFPGINAPEYGTSFPLPYRARSTAPRAGLSSWNSSNPYLTLSKKSDYFRSVVYGIVQGILERLYIFPQYQGYYVDGVNQDYLNYNNLYDGIDSGNEMTLKTEFVGDWYLALESVPLSIKPFATREEIGDESSIRHLKNPLHELAGFISSAFRFIAYDYDPGLGLKEDFPQVGFSTTGYGPSSYVVPLEGWTDGDLANYLAFFASNICIEYPGLCQSAASYKANPQTQIGVRPFDVNAVKWAWKWKDGETYPVESLVQFVRKLPVSFGDVDFICMGGESRESNKLSYAAAETIIPAISSGFAEEIDTSNGPLRYKVYGDAGVMISKDPGGVAPSGYDKTIERLFGNRDKSPDFMIPLLKMNPWPLHLLDAAILGPMQNRMVHVSESYGIWHVDARLTHTAHAENIIIPGEGGLDDNDTMLEKIVLSESGDAPAPVGIEIGLTEELAYSETESEEYDGIHIQNSEEHTPGTSENGEIRIGFMDEHEIDVGVPWTRNISRYFSRRRATRTIGGVETEGWLYELTLFDVVNLGIIDPGVSDIKDILVVTSNDFTSATISTEAFHAQDIYFPRGRLRSSKGVYHPCESLLRDQPFTCFSAYARNTVIRSIRPMITAKSYGSVIAYGDDSVKDTESGAVLVGQGTEHSATYDQIMQPKVDPGQTGWFNVRFDQFHGKLHDKFAETVDAVLYDDSEGAPSETLLSDALSALATEHITRPTLHYLAEYTEQFMRRRDADLLSASLLSNFLWERKGYGDCASIFVPDSANEDFLDQYSTIRFSSAMFNLDSRFYGRDITRGEWRNASGYVLGTTDTSTDVIRVELAIGDAEGGGEGGQLRFGWRHQSGGTGSAMIEVGSRAWVLGSMEVHGHGSSTPWPAINA